MRKSAEYDLVALEDDLKFFPQYKAVFLYRLSLPPTALAALQKIEGTLDESRMIRLNAEAERTKNYSRAADLYFGGASDSADSFSHKLMRWTARHLGTRRFFLAARRSCRCSAWNHRQSGRLSRADNPRSHDRIQTIPSLALLALLVPFRSSESVRAPPSPPFSLRSAADRAQHRDRLAGYRSLARESAVALGLTRCATAQNLFADRLALHSRRNKNKRRHQHRNSHARRAHRRGRTRRADFKRIESQRSRHHSAGCDSGRHSRVARAMVVRFARPRFDSKRIAFVMIAATAILRAGIPACHPINIGKQERLPSNSERSEMRNDVDYGMAIASINPATGELTKVSTRIPTAN